MVQLIHSAMLNVLSNISQIGSCAGSERIYDGLRTSEITLFDFGSDYLKKDRPFAFEGTVIKCGYRQADWRSSAQIGGEKSNQHDDILIYIAEVRPDLFLPVG